MSEKGKPSANNAFRFGLVSLASKRALKASSDAIYELPACCKLEAIKLSSKVATTSVCTWCEVLGGTVSFLSDFKRRVIVGRDLIFEKGRGSENGDGGPVVGVVVVGDVGREGLEDCSGMMRRESTYVAELLARRDSDMHHEPGRGPQRLFGPSAGVIQKARRHSRARAMNSRSIRLEIIILF